MPRTAEPTSPGEATTFASVESSRDPAECGRRCRATFEQLTIPARHVLAAATEAAQAMGSHEVEGAHLLLGFRDTPGVVRDVVQRYLPDSDGLSRDVERVTLPSTGGRHPAFADEVARTVAMAWGISVGRNAASTGTATLLLALLTLRPDSVEQLLRSQHVDLEAFRLAAAGVDDSDEPSAAPPGTATWTVRIGPVRPDGWDDG
jgi:ATP-dependent Clp protease ATP-binding subunit ClpA